MKVLARTTLAVSLACAIGTVSGCAGENRSPRIPSNDGFSGAIIPDRKGGIPYTYVNGFGLCIDKPGKVRITEVGLEHSENGLKIETFAMRKKDGTAPPMPELGTESLADLGYDSRSTTIETVCEGSPPDENGSLDPSHIGSTDLALQFFKPNDRTARGAIIRLKYESEGRTHIHRIGFELVLCEGKESRSDCQIGSYDWP